VSLLNSCLKMVEWIYMTCWLKQIFEKVFQDDQPPLFVLAGTPTNGNHLASFPLGTRHGVPVKAKNWVSVCLPFSY
jgi:hypothetical protein